MIRRLLAWVNRHLDAKVDRLISNGRMAAPRHRKDDNE